MTARKVRRALVVGATTAVSLLLAAPALAAEPAKIVAISSGKSTVSGKGTAANPGNGTPAALEWRGPKRRGTSPLRTDPISDAPSLPGAGQGASAASAKKAKANPELLMDFEGVNHFQQRFAFGGNQFSGEPPDQGLCVGGGYILETVNSALRVYNKANGAPLTPVLALNEFYGFPPAINRTTGVFGPFTFDISCHFDPDSGRWFHLAVDLDQDPATGAFTGRNYLDLAVSHSGDPTGSWTVYRIPAINDGSEGTPDHNCAGGPCFGDFPHLGVDKNGVYITTNEFPLFADGFIGAQVYAISKAAATSGAMSVPVFLFNTADDPVGPDQPGFTLWPSLSPGTQFADDKEYFVSSNAVLDDVDADSDELILWTLNDTSSLSSASPSISLTKEILDVDRYTVPGQAVQKSGIAPLRDCLADTTGALGGGLNCGAGLFGLPPVSLPIGTLDAGDSRVLDVRYANGNVWAVLGTGVEIGGETLTGVGWYILNPNNAQVVKQGTLGLEDEHLTYPTIGVTTSGRGVIGFTRVGPNLFPSVGYASLDAKAGAGEVHMVEAGRAPQDGFTEYPPVGGNRPRWGDYGAAAVDGNNVWLAGEYIQQGDCPLAQYVATGFLCTESGVPTRSSLANWSTRVSKLRP
jgi:hypothetical protein